MNFSLYVLSILIVCIGVSVKLDKVSLDVLMLRGKNTTINDGICNHTLRANHRIYPDINTIFISLQSAPSTPKLRSDILKRLHIESISQSQPFRNRKVRKKTDIQRTAYQKVGFGLLGGTGVIYHPI